MWSGPTHSRQNSVAGQILLGDGFRGSLAEQPPSAPSTPRIAVAAAAVDFDDLREVQIADVSGPYSTLPDPNVSGPYSTLPDPNVSGEYSKGIVPADKSLFGNFYED